MNSSRNPPWRPRPWPASNIFKTPVYGQNQAPAPGSVVGANNRLRVAYIGTGSQGQLHCTTQKKDAAANNIEQVAVCDLSKQRQTGCQGSIGNDCKLYENYEDLLAQKDIDAVTIATCDHWHCKTTLAALDAGKHVYVEKPMTRYLPEAFEVYDKVKATGKILQVGSQGCTAAAWHKAADLIRGGQIGTPVLGAGLLLPQQQGRRMESSHSRMGRRRRQTWIGINGRSQCMTRRPSTPRPISAGASIIPIAPVCSATWCRIASCP